MISFKKVTTFCLILLASMIMTNAEAQTLKTPAASPTQRISQDFGLNDILVEYSRPSTKGRAVFGSLVPYGKIWRTGANAATKLTFDQDVMVQGKTVKAGSYALYTIPDKDAWTIMLYKDLTLGGSVGDYKTSDELMRFNVKPSKSGDFVETFTIEFANMTSNSTDIQLSWENTSVKFSVSADIDPTIMSDIDKIMSKDNRPYYQAASYYYDNNKDLVKALEWATIAGDQNPNAYWVQTLKARIELKIGKKAEAAKTAQNVVNLATKAGNEDYVAIGKDLLAQAKK